MILSFLSLLAFFQFCFSTSTTTNSYGVYPTAEPPPSYGETQPTYAESVVVPDASPCVKTLTRTYTTVVSYASCRPSDYTPPFDPSDNGCTMYQGRKICGRCESYYVWVDETSWILTEHCSTDGCRFVTTGSNPHYDCKQTYTMSDGCVEIVDAQYDWVNTETKCPYREDRCSTTTVYSVSFSGISTFTMCPDSIIPPSGCEFTKARWFPSTYLWCKDACTRLYITSDHTQTLGYPNPCPTPTTVPSGCTDHEGETYCPPSENCRVVTTTYFEGHGRVLVGVHATSCNSSGCSFTTLPEYTGFICDPITRTLYGGCLEIKHRENGTVSTETTCPSSVISFSRCITATYTNPRVTTITACSSDVVLPANCRMTNSHYLSGYIVSCYTSS